MSADHADGSSRHALFELVDEFDRKHEGAHKRHGELIAALGERLQIAEDKIVTLEKASGQQVLQMSTLERRKVEVSNLRFTPSTVIALVLFCASIVGGQKWSTSGISDEIAKQSAAIGLMNEKFNSMKQHEEDTIRLQDERALNVQRQITQMSTQITMLDNKIGSLGAPARR